MVNRKGDERGGPTASGGQTGQQDIGRKLHLLLERYPRGLHLSREDLAIIAWLYCFEVETGSQAISDAHLKWLITEAVQRLSLDDTASIQPTQVIQRLMRLGILRAALSDSTRRGYLLTCLGQGLAANLVEETDYGSEQLSVLLGCALLEVRAAGDGGDGSLLAYLRHAFLGAIREKIEHKLLTIEEDLERREKEVTQTYSGESQADFEAAIQDIEYCRVALTELVDAVQESSACLGLERLLHEFMGASPSPALHEALEQSLNFLYVLRGRVDVMLKEVVQFIGNCIAYRSLAFTVDARDRLCRIQERILTHALDHDLRMPILGAPRVPRMDLNWSRQERERPVVLDTGRLRSLEHFLPPAVPPIEPGWKGAFLEMARSDWARLSRQGGVDLADWLMHLAERLPDVAVSPSLAVWLLTQDWPGWRPPVTLEHCRGEWVPLGEAWMMEATRLIPLDLDDGGDAPM